VGTVNVRVGHDDDLVVADFSDVKFTAATRSDAGDNGLEFLVGNNFFDAGFFHVEHLAPEGKNRLEMPVAAHPGGTAGGVPFDDE